MERPLCFVTGKTAIDNSVCRCSNCSAWQRRYYDSQSDREIIRSLLYENARLHRLLLAKPEIDRPTYSE